MAVREHEALIDELEQALLSVDRVAAGKVLGAATAIWGPVQVAERLVAPALERIGAGWDQGTVALSQVYMGGRICEELVAAILPPASACRKGYPKLAVAVVEDYHQLGSRIVRATLRASGFAVLDYGYGLSPASAAQRAVADRLDILLISALMLPAALSVKEVRSRLDEFRAPVRIVVGGAPFLFDEQLWKEVGADAMARSASEAIELVAGLAGGRP